MKEKLDTSHHLGSSKYQIIEVPGRQRKERNWTKQEQKMMTKAEGKQSLASPSKINPFTLPSFPPPL